MAIRGFKVLLISEIIILTEVFNMNKKQISLLAIGILVLLGIFSIYTFGQEYIYVDRDTLIKYRENVENDPGQWRAIEYYKGAVIAKKRNLLIGIAAVLTTGLVFITRDKSSNENKTQKEAPTPRNLNSENLNTDNSLHKDKIVLSLLNLRDSGEISDQEFVERINKL